MPKRKKHMKLPNGFGSIRYLGAHRRKPYGAFPPVTQFTVDGRAIQPKAIGYAEDWYTAYDLLVAWRNHLQLPAAANTVQIQRKGPTFAEVYERYYSNKFLSNTAKNYLNHPDVQHRPDTRIAVICTTENSPASGTKTCRR